jgi:tetratricopeptide (TPR) repeat protein
VTRALIRTTLLCLCLALAAIPSGCAWRSPSSEPRPDPNLAGSSPTPVPTAYVKPASPQRWSEAMGRGREDLRLGRVEAAEDAFLAALDATRGMRSSDVRIDVTLANLERVAERYRTANRADDFTRVAERVVAASDRRPDRPELASLLIWLGALQREQGKYDEAAASIGQALAIRIRLEGPESPAVVDLHRQLADIDRARGNFTGASRHLERAIEIQESSGRIETADFVDSLVQLAELHSEQGRDDDAVATFDRALVIARQLGLDQAAQIDSRLQELRHEEDPWQAPQDAIATPEPEEPQDPTPASELQPEEPQGESTDPIPDSEW